MTENRADAEYAERNDEEWQDPAEPNTFPSGETAKADRRDARAEHDPDREPTPDEERDVEGRRVDPDVREAYEDAMERGANVKGEGQIET